MTFSLADSLSCVARRGTSPCFLLAAFLYTASIIFLVGVEINELLRKDASAG